MVRSAGVGTAINWKNKKVRSEWFNKIWKMSLIKLTYCVHVQRMPDFGVSKFYEQWSIFYILELQITSWNFPYLFFGKL